MTSANDFTNDVLAPKTPEAERVLGVKKGETPMSGTAFRTQALLMSRSEKFIQRDAKDFSTATLLSELELQ